MAVNKNQIAKCSKQKNKIFWIDESEDDEPAREKLGGNVRWLGNLETNILGGGNVRWLETPETDILGGGNVRWLETPETDILGGGNVRWLETPETDILGGGKLGDNVQLARNLEHAVVGGGKLGYATPGGGKVGGRSWFQFETEPQASRFYKKRDSTKFFQGIYFDPLSNRNKGRYSNAKKLCVIDASETRIVRAVELDPQPRDILIGNNPRQPKDLSSGADREPVHLDDYVVYINDGKGGINKLNKFYPNDGFSISFTRRGEYMFPFGDFLGGCWLTPFQTSADAIDYPGGFGGKNWNVFEFYQDPNSKVFLGGENECRNVQFKEVLIKVRHPVVSGRTNDKWLTVPDMEGEKKIVLTDDPMTYFILGEYSNQAII